MSTSHVNSETLHTGRRALSQKQPSGIRCDSKHDKVWLVRLVKCLQIKKKNPLNMSVLIYNIRRKPYAETLFVHWIIKISHQVGLIKSFQAAQQHLKVRWGRFDRRFNRLKPGSHKAKSDTDFNRIGFDWPVSLLLQTSICPIYFPSDILDSP